MTVLSSAGPGPVHRPPDAQPLAGPPDQARGGAAALIGEHDDAWHPRRRCIATAMASAP